MVVDNEGNIFVSDVGNHRVQKYSSEGQFLNSFGSQGMGPGEFMVSNNIEIGPSGNLYLAAIRKQRFIEFDSNGKTLREFNAEGMPTQRELNLSPLGYYFVGPVTSEFYITSNSTIIFKDMSNFATLRIHDLNGGFLKSFGETYTFEDEFFNRYGNEVSFTVDKAGFIYSTFNFRNRIEKFSSDGELLMRIDRATGFEETSEILMTPRSIQAIRERTSQLFNRVLENFNVPDINIFSSGIATDGKDRIWVESNIKQPDFTVPIDRREYTHFEIYEKDGSLLGFVQNPVNSEIFRIFDNRVFFIDPRETMSVYEYRIIEK